MKDQKIKLEEIGFYTLSDDRAKNTSLTSPLKRCELILTEKCNFNCPYCRGLNNKEDVSFEDAASIVSKWCSHDLENVRFSGGEPTLWPRLDELVALAKENGVNRIAVSTNGSADKEVYERLVEAGVNDFSISFDACCASLGDMMAGNVSGVWNKVAENIKYISSLTYVTIGVVITEDNIGDINGIIKFADTLGIADIRIIPSAQWNSTEAKSHVNIDEELLVKYPILKYRIDNPRHVRGLSDNDCGKCNLMLDDMAVYDNDHYPCVIYMREHGEPIASAEGKTMEEIRIERKEWIDNNDTRCNEICRKNCLDVCRQYNNKASGVE